MKLKEILEKKVTELREKIEASQDATEVRELGETLKAVLEELKEIDEAQEEDPAQDEEAQEEEASREKVPAGAVLRNGNVLGNFGGNENMDNMEYRKAFMENVLKGTPIPVELRQDANTLTSDVSSVIPTQLVNQIIEKFDNVGMILPLISKTSYKAGVVIPTSSVKPVASWVGTSGNTHGEGASSDTQKKTTGQITFSYYKLRCEISMSMEVGTMALSSFEAKFVENVAKAMTYAIENAVVNGNGTYKPKGILAETPETGQAIETEGDLAYAHLVQAESVLPVEYEVGAKWCMSKKTFGKILRLVDDNGQPIARVNYGLGGSQERTILGRDVVISPYVADDKMFIFDFADYVLNTIYDMGISKKQDWDTEDLLTKAVMSVDGKVVDKGSLVTLEITEALA